MSQENVEVVRRFVECWASGNIDAAVTELHPDAEWHNTAVFPGPRTVRGAKAIEDFWRDLTEAWSLGGGRMERVADGGDVVVIEVRGWARGHGSGVPVDTRWAHSFRLQGGKVVCVRTYGSYGKALEAAGLSESG